MHVWQKLIWVLGSKGDGRIRGRIFLLLDEPTNHLDLSRYVPSMHVWQRLV